MSEPSPKNVDSATGSGPGSCPGYRALQAWREGTLPPREADRIVVHLSGCEDCREWLVLTTDNSVSVPTAESIWGSAICVAAIGPGTRRIPGLNVLFGKLEEEGALLADRGDDVPWAAVEVGTGQLTTSPVDVSRLAAWVKRLRKEIRPDGAFGAVIGVGYGQVGPGGAVGEVLEEAMGLAARLQPGQVLLSEEAGRLLQIPGFRTVPVAGTLLRELLPSPSTWAHLDPRAGVRALVTAATQVYAGASLALAPLVARRIERNMAPQRSEESTGLPRLTHLDTLRVEFQDPESGWAYLLLQRDKELTFPIGLEPFLVDGRRVRGRKVLEVLLDDRPGIERPVILVSAEPVPHLEEAVAAANGAPAGSPDDRLTTLSDLLSETYEGTDFALLEAGAVEHVADVGGLDADLLEARKAIQVADFKRAEELLREILERGGRPEVVNMARARLGQTLRIQGKREDALEQLTQAEQMARAAGDIGTASFAACQLGRLMHDAERFSEAWPWLDRAVAGHQAIGDRLGEAYDNLQRAGLFWVQQHMRASAAAYRKVVEAARQAGELVLLGAGLEGLGLVSHELGRLEAARGAFDEALALFTRGRNEAHQMRMQGHLGLVALARGDLETAYRHFEQQMVLVTTVGSPDAEAATRINLSRTLSLMGRLEEARVSLLPALHLVGPQPSRQLHATHLALGKIALQQGDLAEAARLLSLVPRDSALHLELRWRAALCRGQLGDALKDPNAEREYLTGVEAVEAARSRLPRELRRDFLETSASLFEGWIRHITDREGSPEALLEAVERSRARAFLEALDGPEAEDGAEEMGEEETAVTGSGSELLSSDQLKESLPAGALVLEAYSLDDRLLMFRVTRERIDWRKIPLEREELNRLCQEALDYCRSPGPMLVAGETPLQTLSQAVLSPVADWIDMLEPGQPLGFVPHGPLHAVPLHALPQPGNPDQPLLEAHPVFYLPSLQAAAKWLSRAPSAGEGIMAMAPDGELPLAAREARQAVAMMGGGWLEIGAEASRAALKQHAPGARYLHFALHASQGEGSRPAALYLASTDARRGPGSSHKPMSSTAPVARVDTEPVDARWIAGLSLDADLVVLSACESGAGKLSAAGEGHDLLSWAFLSAGARAVVASAWKVDDHATAALMERFYQHLAAGRPRIQALTLAQRELMTGGVRLLDPSPANESEGRSGTKSPEASARPTTLLHPYYWAGFFLTGDWR